MAAYSPMGLHWLRMKSKAAESRHAVQSLLDRHALKLCGSFTLQVIRPASNLAYVAAFCSHPSRCMWGCRLLPSAPHDPL